MSLFPARRWIRNGLLIFSAAILLAFFAGGLAFWKVRASLPILEGEIRLEGLHNQVVVERDDLGVATVRGRSQLDVDRGLGFVHGQERFFQMDLMRRQSAGELAELLGAALVDVDLRSRVHQFRSRACAIVASLPPQLRERLDAYTSGVNQGLEALREEPFEYLVLRAEPESWRSEDSLLVLYSMFFVLNDESGRTESNNGVLFDLLPFELAAFLSPDGTEWDASLTGEMLNTQTIPGPEIWNLRDGSHELSQLLRKKRSLPEEELYLGSNNWAVSGSRTLDGRALVADDMHLETAVPNTWFRAQLEWIEEGSPMRVTGVTLPGTPGVTAGSNGTVAWGFTNSGGDWSDLIILELDSADSKRYLTPAGYRPFDNATEIIQVKGEESRKLVVQSTIWGPVLDEDHRGRPRVLRWTAHLPEGANLRHCEMAGANSLEQALDTAHRSGIPPQNFVCADSAGRIAWTIGGAIPRRSGFDGRLPVSWADGNHRWDGWLEPDEYPVVMNPSEGLLWTANARMVGGEMLARIGTGQFDIGARAGQIRDDLRKLNEATEKDMLAIQLDDRSVFLERWRDLILRLLDENTVSNTPGRLEFRRLVERGWTGRASVDSIGYRLTRAFRLQAFETIFSWLTAPCSKADKRFSVYSLHQWESPLWQLVTKRPFHLLHPSFDSWDEALLNVLDQTIEILGGDQMLSEKRWGELNTTQIQHPISRALPLLSRWLDMPSAELPGDANMPRVQGPRHGASERFAVSPGHEGDGYFHMPGGQSGHPMSPFYRAGHEAWMEGNMLPFLPGEPAYRLVLFP